MRSFWLAVVLLVSQISIAQASEIETHVHDRQDSFEQVEHLPASELLRSAGSFDLLENQEVRSRDPGLRGLNGKPALRSSFGIALVHQGSELLPPAVPPSPAYAERLPYDATAPPQ